MTQGRSIVVKNSAFNSGTQTVPVVATSQNRGISPRPDFVTYTAGNPYPTRNTSSIAYTPIPGASDPSSPYHSNPALLRNQSEWYAEMWCGPRTVQYLGQPSFGCAVVRGDDMRPIWARRRDAAAFQLGTPRD
jgi:hypothetical protein